MPNFLKEDEFLRWQPWPAAYERLAEKIGRDGARDEIRRRLVLGSLRAAARESFWDYEDRNGAERREFELLSKSLWERVSPPTNHARVWTTASFDFVIQRHHDELTTQCNGLRLEPEMLQQILIDAGIGFEPLSLTPEPDMPPALKELPVAEYGHLARAIVAGWGNRPTEDAAWQMAKRLFPLHSVKRREFLAAYRRERGAKNPGKQPSR